jgi:hypothetical protein
MHISPIERNFKEGGKAVRPLVIEDYTTHMSYTDLCDRMTKSYSIRKGTWNWMKKKLLFHLLDLTVLNSYTVCKSCGGNMTHLKF